MPRAEVETHDAVFRTDLQALRGIAILLVVLHHTGLPFLRAGYLGVDVFFTISGFLITRIIVSALERGSFSFTAFYFRRAKRLLPAAYTTFLATALLSVFFLTSQEMRDFSRQLLGSVTFTANIALWMQTGYFEGAAELKPLLHVWSLSLEEQYYMLLPAALYFLPRKAWVPGTLLMFAASLLLCLYLAPIKPGASFYLFPTRAWELALGSLGTLALAGRFPRTVSVLYLPSALVLFVVPFFPTGMPHPGLDALLVCLATLVIMLRQHPHWNQTVAARGLARIGDFSYSLYLVHWPIFAFLNNAYVGQVPVSVKAGAGALALVLGYSLYRCVERPLRRADIRFSVRPVASVLVASALLVALGFGLARGARSATDFAHLQRVNHGLDARCDFGESFTPLAACRSGDAPSMLLFGDSFAMHLAPGIAATSPHAFVQATKSNCGPFLGYAPVLDGSYGPAWSRGCLSFTGSVFDYLKQTPSIEVVVLSSPFGNYANGSDRARIHHLLVQSNGREVQREPSVDSAVAAMKSTVARLRGIGKRVIVVAPPPTSGFDIGGCLERRATGKLALGAPADCSVPMAEYQRRQASVLAFLERVSREADVDVLRFDGLLCRGESCSTSLGPVFLYRDAGHFSYDGSVAIARRMDLGNQLWERAR